MDLSEALDIVVARTGHERFRALCDPAHESYDPAYPPYVIARAEQPEPVQAEGPGWLEMGANFVTAAAQHIATGMHTVDDETASARLAICRSCPQMDGDSCKLCGCHLPLKATWASQGCPEGRWGAVPPP